MASVHRGSVREVGEAGGREAGGPTQGTSVMLSPPLSSLPPRAPWTQEREVSKLGPGPPGTQR